MSESDEQAWARHQELEEHLFGRSPVSFSDVLAGLSPLDDNDALSVCDPAFERGV